MTKKVEKTSLYRAYLRNLLSDTFLAPQAPKILRTFGILVKNRQIL